MHKDAYTERWDEPDKDYPDQLHCRGRITHPIHCISVGHYSRYVFDTKTKQEERTEDKLHHISFHYPPAKTRECHYMSLEDMKDLRDDLTVYIDRVTKH